MHYADNLHSVSTSGSDRLSPFQHTKNRLPSTLDRASPLFYKQRNARDDENSKLNRHCSKTALLVWWRKLETESTLLKNSLVSFKLNAQSKFAAFVADVGDPMTLSYSRLFLFLLCRLFWLWCVYEDCSLASVKTSLVLVKLLTNDNLKTKMYKASYIYIYIVTVTHFKFRRPVRFAQRQRENRSCTKTGTAIWLTLTDGASNF